MRISVFLPDCQYLFPPSEASRHGAFLATTKFLQWVANDAAFQGLEVFLPPAAMCDRESIKGAAEYTLRPENRGKGRLSFYLIHDLPQVWADGTPRIFRSIDPHYMARDRYLRDTYARGPVALSVDTHTMCSQEALGALRNVLGAEPVAYDSIQCVSGSLRESLLRTLESFGCVEPPFRLDVVGRPVDSSRFRVPTAAERTESRERYRIPPNATVAIFHSRVGPYSKADLYPLVQAFADSSGPEDWLIVSGTPTSDTAYEKLGGWLESAGVADRTCLLGSCPHEEVPSRLWAADFFVLPCDNATEGIGIAPVEALATGLPALVSDWDGMRAAVRDGVNGFLVPTYWVPGADRLSAFSPFTPHLSESLLVSQCIVVDEAAMASRMRELFTDRELRRRLGAAGREAAMAFDAPVIQQKLVDMFRSQLEEAAKEPGEVRDRRRQFAERLGLPLNYERVLEGQGTRALSPDDVLELTDVGRGLLAGSGTVPVYEEVGLLASPAVVSRVIERLCQGAQPFGVIESGEGAFVVGVLLKRGAIRLREQVG